MNDLSDRTDESVDAGFLKRQLDDSRRASAALQQMVDALATLPALDQFVPSALRIVAEAIKTTDCAYYEHRPGDPIRLKYWFLDGQVFCSEDIRAFGDDHPYADVKVLEAGFVMPDTYLGVPFTKRRRAQVVDHRGARPGDTWFDLRKRRNWYLSLNAPLVIDGESYGALVVNRGWESTYTPSEINLAEGLAQQLALAMEVDRLAANARQVAVSQARERAARERTEELARHAGVLQETIDSLSGNEDFFDQIGRLLNIASDRLEAPVTEYWTDDGLTRINLVLTSRNGVIYRGSDDPSDVRVHGVPISPLVVGAEHWRDRTTYQIIDMLRDADFRNHVEGFGMPVAAWCRERGVQNLILIPMLRSGHAYGSLCIYLPPGRSLDRRQLDLAFSLAQQASLAVRMIELAEESKKTALSQASEAAANERAAELTKANTLLRAALEQLSDERDLDAFPRSILRMAMEQCRAQDGVVFVLDKLAGTLAVGEHLASAQAPFTEPLAYSGAASVDSSQLWAKSLATKAPLVCDVELDGDLLLPEAVDWHRRRGNRSVVVVPILIDNQPYGYFGMGLAQPVEAISTVDLELIHALTQQASLAIQLSRLAEESKKAALARERERAAEERASEFANVNDVLRSMLARLLHEGDLASFPRTILHEAVRHTGAQDGIILRFDKYADCLMPSEYLNSDGTPPSVDLARPYPTSATSTWSTLTSTRAPAVFDVNTNLASAPAALSAWHSQRGNRSVVAVAMFVGPEPWGYFGITLRERASDVSNVQVGLVHALAQQASLAIQLAELAAASQQAAVMVERQQVVVQERANMAREIHDRLAQGYAAILIQQHTMRRSLLQETNAEARHAPLLIQLDIIERLSRENLAEARRTMDELRIDPFGPGDLAGSLERCVQQLARERGFSVSLHLENDLPLLRRYVETELCRIVVEALTNAQKHARTGAAGVSAMQRDGELQITVRDNGVGFDAQTIGPSFGLTSMHERAARAGARIDIRSKPGWGTEVLIVVST